MFKFDPEFKLWLVANDRPRVRGTDDAFWRRVRVIPLDITIPSGERDPKLSEKLRAEWPGILAWMIEGCIEWKREGLAVPTAVSNWLSAATAGMGAAVVLRMERKVFTAGVLKAGSL